MDISNVLRNRWVQTGAIATISAAAGAVVGYFVGIRVQKEFQTQEYRRIVGFIDDVKQTDADITAVGRIIDKADYDYTTKAYDVPLSWDGKGLVEAELADPIESVTIFEKVDTETISEKPETVNVFSNPNEEWNWEQERQMRKEKDPYILHHEEYFADEMGFTQSTVVYYEGDDILADESDKIVENHAGLLGELLFGHGTTDPNVVYIRNERLQHEWEVCRHSGYFHVEVLGHEMQTQADRERGLQHSVLKFRREDR